MDQVKKFLNIAMQQRFWIICGLIAIIPVTFWFMTTSSMKTVTKARKDSIDGKFKEAQSLQTKADPPNEKSHEEMDKLIVDLRRRVGLAWKAQFDKQTHLLVWPTDLEKEFLDAVRPLTPIEKVKYTTTPKEELLKPSLREIYRNYIKKELPKLADIIGATWVAREQVGMGGSGMPGDSGAMSMPGGDAAGLMGAMPGGYSGYPGAGMSGGYGQTGPLGQALTDNSTVHWSGEDQTVLWARYDWSTKNQEKLPRTLDILYAQEDLWVMTALMNIIAKTNKEATGRYNAVVKDIQYIDLGSTVGTTIGRVSPVGGGMGMGMGMDGGGGGYAEAMQGMMMGESAGASAGMPAMSGAPGASGAMPGGMPGDAAGMPGGMPGDGGYGMGMMAMSYDPADRRYVDFNYQPVAADKLRAAIESEAQNAEEAFLLVAKRIPIRLGVRVDQRKLNRLIAECGNSELMVEIRQVRFNRQAGRSAGGMGGYGMMGGGGMPGDGGGMPGGDVSGMSGMSAMSSGYMGSGGSGFSGMPGDDGSAGYGGSSSPYGGGFTQNSMPDMSAHDKIVELFGVVYIYNPVDVKKLRLEDVPAPAATTDTGG